MKMICSFFLLCLSIATQAQFQLLTHQEKLTCLNKKFSIVAHVVLDGDGAMNITEEIIQNNVDSLNTYFEPICVDFEICEFRTIPNFQYDTLTAEEEWKQLQIENHLNHRINIFFVNDFDSNLSSACGFASLGGIGMVENGGIVLKKVDCLERPFTMLHEMGHYFGLLHTFEGSGEELVNGDNCETTGDLICDTPADPYVEDEPLGSYVDVGEDCRFISQKIDANGEYYRPDVGNIMSYYPSECTCGFTLGQYQRMVQTCQASNGRMW